MELSTSGTYGSWIQEGWAAGCLGTSSPNYFCTTSSGGIDLYVEGAPPPGDLTNYELINIGGLNYSSRIYLYIEYFPNVGGSDCPVGSWTGPCWKTYYNGYFEGQWNSGGNASNGYPASGAAGIGSEVSSTYMAPGDPVVEMPTTIYGSSSPSTTGLRIKGASGYVSWNTSLPSEYTSQYDERNCPQAGNCPFSKPYYISNFNNFYYVEGYGQCGSNC